MADGEFAMTFQEVLAQVLTWLEHDKRLSYRALQRQWPRWGVPEDLEARAD